MLFSELYKFMVNKVAFVGFRVAIAWTRPLYDGCHINCYAPQWYFIALVSVQNFVYPFYDDAFRDTSCLFAPSDSLVFAHFLRPVNIFSAFKRIFYQGEFLRTLVNYLTYMTRFLNIKVLKFLHIRSFLCSLDSNTAMSNQNGLLDQISCRYLNQGRTMTY